MQPLLSELVESLPPDGSPHIASHAMYAPVQAPCRRCTQHRAAAAVLVAPTSLQSPQSPRCPSFRPIAATLAEAWGSPREPGVMQPRESRISPRSARASESNPAVHLGRHPLSVRRNRRCRWPSLTSDCLDPTWGATASWAHTEWSADVIQRVCARGGPQSTTADRRYRGKEGHSQRRWPLCENADARRR
jgi:hypothetical protein